MESPKKNINVRVPSETHDKLKRLAKKEDRSLSNYIKLLIEEIEE